MPSIPSPVVAIADLEILAETVVDQAQAAVRGGLVWLCLRARRADTAERVRLGRPLVHRPGTFLTVHGDPEACRALGAPGLHLPSQGFDLAAARRRFPDRLLGISCHRRDELEAAVRAGADYAFLSPLFRPASKALRGGALGVDGFRRLAEGVGMPVLALGGVTPDRLAEAANAGASGVAVLGALFLAPDVESQARRYREEAERVFGSVMP